MKLRHICENCGKTEDLTSEEGFDAGWDYPPRMGSFGIISPRTCGDCGIQTTVWWALVTEKKEVKDLTPEQMATVVRIQNEPESILIP